MPASRMSNATWMPRGRSSSAAALVIALTPNDPAAHSPRPAIARRAEPPVTCTSAAAPPRPRCDPCEVAFAERTAPEGTGALAAAGGGRVHHELDSAVSGGRLLECVV